MCRGPEASRCPCRGRRGLAEKPLPLSLFLLSVLATLADALQLPKLASLRLFVTIATPIHPRASLCYYYYNYTGALFCSTTTTPAGGGWRKKEIGWWRRRRRMKLRSFFNSYLNPRTFCVAGRTPTRSGADVTPSPAAAATAAGAAHLKRRCQTLWLVCIFSIEKSPIYPLCVCWTFYSTTLSIPPRPRRQQGCAGDVWLGVAVEKSIWRFHPIWIW